MVGLFEVICEKEYLFYKRFYRFFRVGNLPTLLDQQTRVQLFASTVIGDKILTVNASILFDGDFRKAGLIVNEIMETMLITKQ